MRKPTKRWAVETWDHRASGGTLTVYYDKDTRKFWAPVANREVEDETQAGARRKAEDLANVLLVSEDGWRRVIFIWTEEHRGQVRYGGYGQDNTHNSPRVGFDFARAWVRESAEGVRFTRLWDRESKNRFDQERMAAFKDVKTLSTYWDDEHSAEIPYTDELWERLHDLSTRLRSVRDALTNMVRSETFVEALMAGMPILLPPAQEQEDDDQ